MIIRHFSYSRRHGGAFIACDRLDRALVAQGIDSAIVTDEMAKQDIPDSDSRLGHIVDDLKSNLWKTLVGERTYVTNTHFSLGVDGPPFFTKGRLGDPDVLHLHWVAHLLNADSLARLADLRVPLIWTLHDANPFTAGCHYPAGCENFATGCKVCPQISRSGSGWTAFSFQAKQEALKRFGKVVVTAPSQWLLSMARQSAIFEGREFRVMKNCIPACFHARSRRAARAKHGLERDEITILFAAVDLAEVRKGALLAVEALRLVVTALQQAGRHRLIARLRVVALGRGAERLQSELAEMALAIKDFSYVDSEPEIAEIYSLTDFVLLPSFEDNFPNIITEAAACGASVLGLPCAGPGEIIPEIAAGAVASDVSAEAYASLLEEAVIHVERFRELAAATAGRVETAFSPAAVASEFVALYEECSAGGARGTGVGEMSVQAPGVSVLATASRFFDWDYAHPARKSMAAGPLAESDLPVLDVLGRTLVSPAEVAAQAISHTASGAMLAVAKISNLPMMIPGSRICAWVVNTGADPVTARLVLANLQSEETVLAPGADLSLDISIAAPGALDDAAILYVALRRPLNYGIVRAPITIRSLLLVGENDPGGRSAVRELEVSPRSRSDERVKCQIASNFYAAEKFRNTWAVWLGPENATRILLERKQARSILVIVSVLEKSFPEPLSDVTLLTEPGRSWRVADSLAFGETSLLLYEIAVDAAAPLREFSILSPFVFYESGAPDPRKLGIMVANLVVLPHRSPGGVAVFRPGAIVGQIDWRDVESIACRFYLSDDGFIYFQAEGVVLVSGQFSWSIVTDMLSADDIDADSRCWLGRASDQMSISCATQDAEGRLRIEGAHDFEEPICFRGLSFKLNPLARMPSRALLAQHRFFLNVTTTSALTLPAQSLAEPVS